MSRLILSVFLVAASAAGAAEGPVDRALEAELKRATTQLKADGYPAPYFVSLAAHDTESWERRCALGSLGLESRTVQRIISADVRVGSYELDNHPVGGAPANLGRLASVEDDEFALRHGLWRLLDGAYKSASADFLRKQALRVSRGKTEYDTDDLSREKPRLWRAERPADPWSRASLGELCLALSRPLRDSPRLLHAESTVRLRRLWTRLKDSEGTRADFGRESAELEVDAVDISTDGTRLFASRRWVVTSPEDLPSASEVVAEARAMLAELEALKEASSTSPFSAPALLDPSVSAAVLLAIGQRLSGEEQRNPGGAQTFRSQMGKRVMPEDFTVVDDPSLQRFGSTALAGRYELDDEAIPPQKTVLIQGGVLTGHLLSRYPVIGFPRSNGHGRASPGYRAWGSPGVLVLSTKRPLSQQRLLRKLRDEVQKRGKPYGLWVKGLRHFSQQQGTGGHASIRLMPGLLYLVEAATGKLTLVRDLDAVGTPLVLMANMLAAGDDPQAKNYGGAVPVSVVAPSLLLADLELQRAETKPEKEPILPPPAASASDERKSPPIVPRLPHVQVNRYRLRGLSRAVPAFVMDGLLELRQHQEGADLVLDAKLRGRSLSKLGDAARRLDVSVERLAGGKPVDKAVLVPAMTETSYRSMYGAGWP